MRARTLLAELLGTCGCIACGAAAGWPCCAACLPVEPSAPGPWRLAAAPAITLWTLGPYQGALRATVVAGKLHGQPAALATLGRRLGAQLAAAGAGADLITWVASRPGRGRPREHARAVAEAVGSVLHLPVVRLLRPAPGPDLGRARGTRPARPPPASPGPHPTARRLTGGR
jgi:predicted amidophosphoribosyltransferase